MPKQISTIEKKSDDTEAHPPYDEANDDAKTKEKQQDAKDSSELEAVSALQSLVNVGETSTNSVEEKSEDEDHDSDSMDEDHGEGKTGLKKGKKTAITFPQRLMSILSKEEHSDVISWIPHGLSFIVYNRRKFVEDILPRYFKESKYTSFTRKLNRWGFTRVSKGIETGAYYHQYFRRDDPQLCSKMRCQKKYERKRQATFASNMANLSLQGQDTDMAQPVNQFAVHNPSPMSTMELAYAEHLQRARLLQVLRMKHQQEQRLQMEAALRMQLASYQKLYESGISGIGPMTPDAVPPAMLQSNLNQQSALSCLVPSSQLQLLRSQPSTPQTAPLQQSWPLESTFSLGRPNMMQSASGYKSQNKPTTPSKSAQSSVSKSLLEKLQEFTKRTAPGVLQTKRPASSSLERPKETPAASAPAASGPLSDSSASKVKQLSALKGASVALLHSGKTQSVANNISSNTMQMKSDFSASLPSSTLKEMKNLDVKPPARANVPKDEEKQTGRKYVRRASAA